MVPVAGLGVGNGVGLGEGVGGGVSGKGVAVVAGRLTLPERLELEEPHAAALIAHAPTRSACNARLQART